MNILKNCVVVRVILEEMFVCKKLCTHTHVLLYLFPFVGVTKLSFATQQTPQTNLQLSCAAL